MPTNNEQSATFIPKWCIATSERLSPWNLFMYTLCAHIHVQVCMPFNTHRYFSWFPWLSYFVTCIWMPDQNLGTPGLVLHLPERHQGLCTAWQGLPWFGEVHYVHFTVLTSAMWKSHLCLLNQLHLKSISMAQVRCWPSSGCDSLHGWPGPPKTKVTSGCWVSTVPTWS